MKYRRVDFAIAFVVVVFAYVRSESMTHRPVTVLTNETHLDVLLGDESYDVLNKTHVKHRLEKLFRIMDINKNNRVEKKELKKWVYKSFLAAFEKDCTVKLKFADTDGDGKLSWDETKIFTFGELEDEDDMTYVDYEKEIEHDEQRFHAADIDGDGWLSRDEFFAYLHPEMYDHLQEFITWKFFEDFDRDGDGSVTQSEYIGPNPWPDEEDEDEEGEEPKWVAGAIERFQMIDSNGDGELDVPEVLDVMLPNLHLSAAYGAKLIMEEADDNGDGKLSLKEMKTHYKAFLKNEEVDFNGQIRRIRDEL